MQREAAQALGLIGHPQKKVLPWLRFSLTNTEKQSGALAGKSKLHPAAVWVCSCVTSSPSPCSLQLASGTLVPSGKRNCQMNSLARRQKFRQTATTPGREAGAGWAPGTDSKGEAPCSRSACPLLCSCSTETATAHLTPSGCRQPGFPASPLQSGARSWALAPSGTGSSLGKSLHLAEPRLSRLHMGDTTRRFAGLVYRWKETA